jgi:hypothetical protein
MKAFVLLMLVMLAAFAVMLAGAWGIHGVIGVGVPSAIAVTIAFLLGKRSYDLAIIGVGTAMVLVFFVAAIYG